MPAAHDESAIARRHGRALLEAVSDLVLVVGTDGVYRAVKAESETELAAPPDRLVGSSVEDVLPPEVAERIMACARRAREHDSVEPIEYDLELGGRVRTFEGRVAASAEDEFVLLVRDVTDDRRRADELRRLADELESRVAELGRERDFTRTLVRAVPIFLVLADDAGHLLGLNDSTEEATDLVSGEQVGKPFWEVLLPAASCDEGRELIETLRSGQTPQNRELPLATRDGELRLVEWSGTPVTDQFGLKRIILSGVDVTERVRQAAELRGSRARIVAAGDAERRRLQRNLHDGAQQQLVFVSHALRLASAAVDRDPARTRELLGRAVDGIDTAHAELRELARGLHPPLLAERGLPAALRALAARAPVLVTVEAREDDRFSEAVETAAYYVVAEALTNVAKYARAQRAVVRVARQGDAVVVEIEDDGVGGADMAAGSGLRGLADRVEALAGMLSVESPAEGGTRLRAELPVDASRGPT